MVAKNNSVYPPDRGWEDERDSNKDIAEWVIWLLSTQYDSLEPKVKEVSQNE